MEHGSESILMRNSINMNRASKSLLICFCLPHETERFATADLTTLTHIDSFSIVPNCSLGIRASARICSSLSDQSL